ncbi:hypothetical protein CsSME_00002601 [Camellia sinensis var. sinensis]
MELVLCKCVFAFLLSCLLIFTVVCSVEGIHGDSKVRGVNLGGWLVVEGWIKPSLFDGIPNGDMLDGTYVQLKSVTLQKYVSAENGGGMNVTVDRDIPSSWETFTLWRVSESEFQFRTSQGQFLTCDGDGGSVSSTAESPSRTETFYVERNNNRVHLKLNSGTYLQDLIMRKRIGNGRKEYGFYILDQTDNRLIYLFNYHPPRKTFGCGTVA